MDPATTVPAYDLRVSIKGTELEIWRRLLVPETITVPELHRVLQTAFGWENRHLFGTRCVDRPGQSRVIIGPDDAAEEMGDEPASGVVLSARLDAQQTGPSTLEYEYDFGDAWTHIFDVMGPAELPASASSRRAGTPAPSSRTRSTPTRSTAVWTSWRNASGRNRRRTRRSTPSSVPCSGY